MRILRVTFVSLIAVGVCGGVYVGLTVGLAAYMSYKTGGVASGADAAGPPTAARAATPDTNPSAKEAVAPPPAMEDAAGLLRRTWTANKPGLSSPATFTTAPTAGLQRIVPSEAQPWRTAIADAVRPRHWLIDPAFAAASKPAEERPPIPVELTMAAPEPITFPSLPPVRTSPPESTRIRLATIGVDRAGDRPQALEDVTLRVGETLLLSRPAPGRAVAATPEKLVIPDPTPFAIGDARTVLPADDIPPTSLDRPERVVLPAK